MFGRFKEMHNLCREKMNKTQSKQHMRCGKENEKWL